LVKSTLVITSVSWILSFVRPDIILLGTVACTKNLPKVLVSSNLPSVLILLLALENWVLILSISKTLLVSHLK